MIRRVRGQALALFALTLLLLTLMVLMTVSIGMNAARRADLNNTADATAWAAAVTTARTYNSAAIMNRAIIAHYVTMAGIEAQMAYVSEAHNAFNMAGTFFRMFDMTGDPVTIYDAFQGRYDPSGRCPQLTTEVRDASYEMWHAALFFYSPGGTAPPAWPGDSVDGYCLNQPCPRRRPFARSDGWLQESIIDLEKKAAEELKGAHLAIHELAAIQRATYRELRREVGNGTLAQDIAAEAKGDTGLQVEARTQAKAELDSSTRTTSNGMSYAGRWKGYEQGLADAIMGTRPRERLSLMGNPTNQDNFTPLFVQLRDFADQAFAAYPGQPFTVAFSKSDVTSDYTWIAQDNEPYVARRREDPMGPPNPLEPGMGYAYGRAQGGTVVVTYNDACTAGTPTRTIRSGPPDPSPRDPVTGQHYVTLPMGVMIRSSGVEGRHQDYASDHLDGQHWTESNGTGPMGCHQTHAHYGATQVDQIHQLDDETLPPEILAFVLPEPDPSRPGGKGGHGLWGQPVVPIFLTRSFPFSGDPWALKFRFGFTSAGADLDMQRGNVMTASAAGVAHYHRRGHLGEPPNLMNPFWRATLQPMEVDARRERFDPTFDTQLSASQRPMMDVLQNDVPQYGGRTEARRAYNQLRQVVHGMERHPGTNGGVVR